MTDAGAAMDGKRPRRLRRGTHAIGLLACLAGLLAFLPGSAHAKVVEVANGSETLSAGVQQRSAELHVGGESALTFANAQGNPVLPSTRTYALYWDPYYLYAYHGDWQHLIDTFMHNIAGASGSPSNVFAVDAQYTDAAGQHASYETTFAGAYTDVDPYPQTPGCSDPVSLEPGQLGLVTCLSDAQIRTELERFISANSLPTGMGAVYYVLTPPGVTICLDEGGLSGHCSDDAAASKESQEDSFCSYHSFIGGELPNGGPGTIIYAAIPWTAGGLGDLHLTKAEQKPAYECQDGGWNPAGEAGEEYEEPPEGGGEGGGEGGEGEGEESGETEAEPETPHQQEPNQLPEGVRGPDGTYDTGLADLIINQIAVEQQDIVTDPLLNAWRDAEGDEAVDECRNVFALTEGGEATTLEHTGAGTLYNQEVGGGDYYLNDAFDLAAYRQAYPGAPCVLSVALEPQFTVPAKAKAGEALAFNAHESNITLDGGTGYTASHTPFATYPTYDWSFGDGTSKTSSATAGWNPNDEPSVLHTYSYGGTYEVTLTVTDTAGNVASVTEPVTVAGPPPPVQASGPAATPGPSSVPAPASPGVPAQGSPKRTPRPKRGAHGAGAHGAGAHAQPSSRPVLTITVVSHSLEAALRKGLLVRYSVDQQVAGRFKVFVSRRLARHLHIRVHKGTSPKVAVATGLLVTTKAARGRERVLFSAAAKQGLAHMKKLQIMVQVSARNADRKHPKTTLLSHKATLRR